MCGRIWTTSLLLLVAAPAAAVECGDMDHLGQSYTVCRVDAGSEDLALYHTDDRGAVIGGFDALAALHPDRQLVFAMNAGMYHEDRSPVGLFVKDGAQTAPLVTSDGPGNFGLLPNGVFCLSETGARIIESRSFAANAPQCRDATQSGPMLVIDGALHPKFLPDSASTHIRNGVGVAADGRTAYFAISNAAVNFHDFATLFRDVLQTPNALFFDGSVSRLFAPQIGRDDFGFQLGPMVAVFE